MSSFINNDDFLYLDWIPTYWNTEAKPEETNDDFLNLDWIPTDLNTEAKPEETNDNFLNLDWIHTDWNIEYNNFKATFPIYDKLIQFKKNTINYPLSNTIPMTKDQKLSDKTKLVNCDSCYMDVKETLFAYSNKKGYHCNICIHCFKKKYPKLPIQLI